MNSHRIQDALTPLLNNTTSTATQTETEEPIVAAPAPENMDAPAIQQSYVAEGDQIGLIAGAVAGGILGCTLFAPAAGALYALGGCGMGVTGGALLCSCCGRAIGACLETRRNNIR